MGKIKIDLKYGIIREILGHDQLMNARQGIETVEGEWETNGYGDVMEWGLDFGSVDPFHAIDEEWEVTEYAEKTINLKESGGGNDTVEVLVLEKK